MNIIINGNIPAENLDSTLTKALANATTIIRENNPELGDMLNNDIEQLYVTTTDITLGFKVKGSDDVQVLTANHYGKDEMLTFIYDLDGSGNPSLTDFNDDAANKNSIYSDKSHALADVVSGFTPIEPTLSVEGAKVIFYDKVGLLHVQVYDNGVVRYYKDGNLVEEGAVKAHELEEFLSLVEDLATK